MIIRTEKRWWKALQEEKMESKEEMKFVSHTMNELMECDECDACVAVMREGVDIPVVSSAENEDRNRHPAHNQITEQLSKWKRWFV